MLDKTPRGIGLRLPDRSMFDASTRAHTVSRLFTLTYPNAVSFIISPRSGAFGASWVPQRISSCMPRPEDSAGSPQPSPSRLLLCCLRCALIPSASGTDYVEAVPALQGARPPLRPTGFSVYAYLISLFVITDSAMRSTRDTGGWLALPRQGLSPCKIRWASPSAITLPSAEQARQRLCPLEGLVKCFHLDESEPQWFFHLYNDALVFP